MPKRQVKFDLQTIVAMAFVRTISPLKPTSIWQLPTYKKLIPTENQNILEKQITLCITLGKLHILISYGLTRATTHLRIGGRHLDA